MLTANKKISILLISFFFAAKVFASGVLPVPSSEFPSEAPPSSQSTAGGQELPSTSSNINFELENENDKCRILSGRIYFPVGDTRGHTVLTKKEIVRECNITKEVRGKCLRWKEEDRKYSEPTTMYDTYDTEDYSDTMGSLMAIIGSYDQIEHLWSGWHGFCHIGTVVDFSWAQNPFFWGSLIMSTILQGSQEESFLHNTSLGNTVNGFEQGVANQFGELASRFSPDLVQDQALEAANQAAQNAYAQAGSSLTAEMANQAFQQGMDAYMQNLGACLMASGFNMTSALYEFAKDDEEEVQCDPVDEICSPEEQDDQLYEDQIMTADATQFDDLIAHYESQYDPSDPNSINIHDYIEEIKRENGVVTFRFKKINELAPGQNLSNQEMTELMRTMKVVKFAVKGGLEALKIAGCVGGTGVQSFTVPQKDDGRLLSVRSGISAAISFSSKFLGPYGPLINAGLQVVLNVVTSFRHADSCHDEDDAVEAGKRHERTYYSLQFDLCHFVKKKCIDKSWTPTNIFANNCILHGYYYCCYDQILSKILVEQLKAQLGRDWTHCTGITLSDLNHVSFRECTSSDKQSGPDGAEDNLPEDFDYTSSYQYKKKCINLDEFKEYLRNQVDGEIDMGHFNQFWEDLSDQMDSRTTF